LKLQEILQTNDLFFQASIHAPTFIGTVSAARSLRVLGKWAETYMEDSENG